MWRRGSAQEAFLFKIPCGPSNQKRPSPVILAIAKLVTKGYLDEQFIQIEMLQDETSPNFVEDVLMLFLRDSTKLVNDIEQTL
ncbi:Histidine-containing phosphotransfer protein 4 [Acorus calamus]|uniref:Histidine-containing phosphotransfer protein n=1 Tax=Acorus calamus TaxID=4465 RepID=A0AAV9D2U1_ACOCL|nr:Histidine-containing phosphotransfer protein 4 [Acorus calamus]